MQNLFLICSNLYLEHARSAYLLISISFLFAHCRKGQILQGITQTFFKWVLRPMTPEIEPSYNEETLHETQSIGKGFKKVQDYFQFKAHGPNLEHASCQVQHSADHILLSQQIKRTCFPSSVTFRPPCTRLQAAQVLR